jgi:tetrapyrrole methylase family protein/MazG family protein
MSSEPDVPGRTPGAAIEELLRVMARLRGPGGCPWDARQTLETLKPFLIEETYEVLDAIEADDRDEHREELGDLLLQVVFQARLREEEGAFAFGDVVETLIAKLVRRHPHVFQGAEVRTPDAVLKRWEAIKASEKGETPRSVLAGVPRQLPALQRAQQVQGRAARVGFDWTETRDVAAKVEEEWAETRAALDKGDPKAFEEEIGDLLFAIVNLCRFQGIQAEQALDRATGKFIRRFQAIEERLRARGQAPQDLSLAELDALWEAAKREERA